MDFELPDLTDIVKDKELSQIEFKRTDIEDAAANLERSLVHLCALQYSHLPAKELENILFPYAITVLGAYIGNILVDEDDPEMANVHLFCHQLVRMSKDLLISRRSRKYSH